MRGLVFDLSIPRYLVARSLGRALPRVHYGTGSCVSLRRLSSPALPGGDWVRLRPILAGLCGSDIATMFFKTSPQLEPFNSFPAVLGHEVVAEVLEPGPLARGLERGQRVVVDPLLPCRLRGLQQRCPQCARGLEHGCERVAEGCLAPGQMLGFHRDLPGGIGTELVAHVSQLHPVPERVSDKAAVLVEPLSVSVHAVLKNPPASGERVLVIGGGPMAFATLWALRALGHDNEVTLLTAAPGQTELAHAMGASHVMRTAPALEEAEQVARSTGGRVYRPVVGPPVITGGYELTFDCVGSAESVGDSLRYTRPLGRVVLIGAAGRIAVDWTSVWRNELTVAGSYTYGLEHGRGEGRHTFDLVLRLLDRGAGPDPVRLVTHVFALEQYREAIEANVRRGDSGAMKTVFAPGDSA